MGTAKAPKPAKYFVALLFSDLRLLPGVEKELTALLGKIDGCSDMRPWTESKFYQNEMGPGLQRFFLSFATLRSPAELAPIKLRTQQIEERYRDQLSNGRRVNLDPGYVDAFKLVLASTKNAGQRIYLDGGIYAEATLMYHDGRFHGLPHTYPDYLWPDTLMFMTGLRALYLEGLRQIG
jgi:hypothetical protein